MQFRVRPNPQASDVGFRLLHSSGGDGRPSRPQHDWHMSGPHDPPEPGVPCSPPAGPPLRCRPARPGACAHQAPWLGALLRWQTRARRRLWTSCQMLTCSLRLSQGLCPAPSPSQLPRSRCARWQAWQARPGKCCFEAQPAAFEVAFEFDFEFEYERARCMGLSSSRLRGRHVGTALWTEVQVLVCMASLPLS